jgi:integrase
MKLTETFIKSRRSTGKVQKYADGSGLFLYITPTGKKSWRLAYRFMGKQKLLVIGPYPEIGLVDARNRRTEARRLLVENIDPSVAKQRAKAMAVAAANSSFAMVALEWLEKYSGNWSEAYTAHVRYRFEEMVFPYLGKRAINTISAPELLVVLRKIENRGVICVAHLTRRDCGRVFRYAIATGRAERDVAADLRGALAPMRTTQHFATITDPKRIGELLQVLDDATGALPHIIYALRLAPLVFVRAKELANAQWSQFDLESGEWRIPASIMKMRQVHIVPLSRQALGLLLELRSLTGSSPYLFPGRPKRIEKGMSIRSQTLVCALRRLGYSKNEMTFHGFRSMASTVLNEKGYNRDWIERQLAHTERSDVRASYNYAEYLPERRKMMQDWADYLDRLRPNGSVQDIRRAVEVA